MPLASRTIGVREAWSTIRWPVSQEYRGSALADFPPYAVLWDVSFADPRG